MTTTLRRPPGRYDEPRTLSRPLVVTLVSLLALAVLGGLFVAWRTFESRSSTQYTVLGYTVLSDTSVEVRFEVPLSPGATAHCTLRARGQDGSEVGRDEVQVGPQRTSPVRVAHVLTTRSRAVTGEVTGCSP